MVLFQPGSTPPTVWEFGWYSFGEAIDIVLWISAIIAIFFALFLMASYLNNRKPEHLYWGISFAAIWINTHIAIAAGTYAYFLDPVPSALFALAVGLFAVGLFKNVKPEKEKMGNYLLYYVIIMAIVIGFVKNPYWGVESYGFSLLPTMVVPIVVMALHIPSAILIIWLPLQTREENGKSALAMTIAGVLMGVVGLLLGIATLGILATDDYLNIVLTAFPFIYLLAVMGFAWGTFVPKRWAFNIAGIELED
jgi:hypothetical protein